MQSDTCINSVNETRKSEGTTPKDNSLHEQSVIETRQSKATTPEDNSLFLREKEELPQAGLEPAMYRQLFFFSLEKEELSLGVVALLCLVSMTEHTCTYTCTCVCLVVNGRGGKRVEGNLEQEGRNGVVYESCGN